MDHLREAESPAAEPAVKVVDGTPPPTAELPVLPKNYCKDMMYYFESFDLLTIDRKDFSIEGISFSGLLLWFD